MEQWKDIAGYEGFYQVSTFGRVKSFHKGGERILKPAINKGRFFVVLCRNGAKEMQKVHRLVASAFIPNPENKPQVNHIDGNPLNNHVKNLEWVTQTENIQHAVRMGLIPSGEGNYQAGLTNEQAAQIREMYKPRDSEFGTVGLGKRFGVSNETINYVIHGKTYKNAGGKIRNERPLKITVEQRKKIRQLRKQGLSLRVLAKTFHCGKTTIRRIIDEK